MEMQVVKLAAVSVNSRKEVGLGTRRGACSTKGGGTSTRGKQGGVQAEEERGAFSPSSLMALIYILLAY